MTIYLAQILKHFSFTCLSSLSSSLIVSLFFLFCFIIKPFVFDLLKTQLLKVREKLSLNFYHRLFFIYLGKFLPSLMRKYNARSPIPIALAVYIWSRAFTDGNCLSKLCSIVFKNSLLPSIKILFAFTTNYTN